MRNKFLTAIVFCLFVPAIIFAQSGKITGKVIDAGSGQPLSNATITLIEKSKVISADLNGDFSFSKLEGGSFSIKCSYAGYKEKIVEAIIVKANDNTSITISLDQKKSDEVVVSAKRVRAAGETVASLLVAQKNSANVQDGITAESIRKTPDKTTSDVLKRVSGASIQDDRFAIIRGLNDRYNAAFINGAPLPSTESDRKAFAFDIFPSAILDNLVIYKTATPDKTGEFAGGIIDITTKSIPSKNFTSLSYSATWNSLITGNSRFFSENKGKKDWIGLDDGTRGIPAGIPATRNQLNSLSFAQRAELAKLFGNYKWGIKKQNSTNPNYNFQLSKGFNIPRKEKEFLGALFSVNYNRNYTFTDGERNGFVTPAYFALDPADTVPPLQEGKYIDSVYNDEVIVALLGNIGVKINNRHNISWKNNLSINTDNKLTLRKGYADFSADSNTVVSDRLRSFTSSQIFTSQLNGEHQVGSIKTKINWLAGYSKVVRNVNLSRTGGSFGFVSIVDPPSQTTGSGTFFFTKSDENIKSIKIDITQPYTFLNNSQNNFKIGGGYLARARGFTGRLLAFGRYNDPNNGIVFDNSLSPLPEDQIFLPQHLGLLKNGLGGFTLADGTIPNTNYEASSTISHFYVMAEQRFLKKFRLILGQRMETFNQKLYSVKSTIDTLRLDKTVTDFLPSVNLIYAATPKMNLRLSYSQTVNRPEYRELADFIFYEFQSNLVVSGYNDIKRALITNYDFRYEFFPGKAQVLSVSAFYKDFDKPIELISLPLTSSQVVYLNGETAKVYGLEAEFRILIASLFGIKNENNFLNKLTLSANAAYTKSNIKLDSTNGFLAISDLASDRPLQGQSPYIINGSLGYNNDKIGLSTTVSANRVGDRIFVAGTARIASIYEKARTVVDFQVAKFFLKNALELKFTARDILAQNVVFYYDFDQTESFTVKDRVFSSVRAPKGFSFSATLKF